MPILTPTTGPLFTISDLGSEVIFKVENRITDVARAYQWLVDALLEITSNPDFRDDFAQLEILGPAFVLTGGPDFTTSVQEYDESNIIPAGDLNLATLDIMLWRDPPTNSNRIKLGVSHYQEVDKSTLFTTVPSSWYRFAGNIGFYPSPDLNYQVQARILRYHPIASQIELTTVLLPRDWNEILVMAAAERGFIELGEYEKASAIHTLLFGDPKHPEKPGLIKGRKTKRSLEANRTSRPLKIVIPRYTWR